MKKALKILAWIFAIILALVIVLVVIGYLYRDRLVGLIPGLMTQLGGSSLMPNTDAISESVGNVPELNPIEKANPFKGVYTNPFE